VLVGRDAADADFDTAEEEGGVKTVTLTGAQSGLPQHQHQILRERSGTTGGATTRIARTNDTSSTVDTTVFTENIAAANAAQAHTNVQPYIVVYMWKRTA
jgi:microcystin-dependent protein